MLCVDRCEDTTMTPRFDLPRLGYGIGLRSVHYPHILAERPRNDFFEVLSDNYLNTRGRPLWFLEQIARDYPLVLHGVGLSIGSTDPLDERYLSELKALRDRFGACWVSDHIAWSGVNGRHGHDLYPVPFTEEALWHIVRRVRQVQDVLEAPLVLENPSTYLRFAGSTLSEADFVRALVEEADAALLLDVNNVYVNAHNHGFDAIDYIDRLPLERVVQFHVAGHTEADGYLADTHGGEVVPGVWKLLLHAFQRGARAAVLVEWDADIPDFDRVQREALRARSLVGGAA
jgi:uncharacterized protein (UPF0276 family)